MAHTDLTIPSLGYKFIDLRDILPGDAYNFNWERSLDQVNYLAIHHTGGADSQTPRDLANEHMTKNGWGGIGYHFLINKQGEVFYVGDISTARANVANLNEQVIGIGLIGNFVAGSSPTEEQINSAHLLGEYLLNYADLINVKSWDKVRGHSELPGQSTDCPGDNWQDIRIKIVEGVIPVQSQVDSLQASLAFLNQQAISLQGALQEREEEIRQLKSQPSTQKPDTTKTDETLTIVGALINLYKFLSPPGKES